MLNWLLVLTALLALSASAQQPPDAVAKAPAPLQDAAALVAPERLSRNGLSDEEYAFKQQVYRLHVERGTKSGRTRIFDLAPADLALIPGTKIQMRKDAAAALGRLLGAARDDLARDLMATEPDAATQDRKSRAQRVQELAINNAYRSASSQFAIWDRNFKQYYDATTEQRRACRGGEHGLAAAELLRDYIGVRVAAPGFSNHQSGIAVDFALLLKPDPKVPDGDKALAASMAQGDKWKESWFWRWLVAKAGAFGFVPYEPEPWHWEYKPDVALAATQNISPPNVVTPHGTTQNVENALAPLPPLQSLVNDAAQSVLTRFADKGVTKEQFAITLVDLRDVQHPNTASFRGDVPIYPASVVKLFYLVAAQRELEDGKLQDSPELQRGLHDMIVDSNNDAAGYVLDAITGTTSGPELPAAEMQQWIAKRNAVNRYFEASRYKGINVNQKPWNEGPYGRERVFVGPNYENRNMLTTDATARLLTEIVTGRAVTSARSAQMMTLLQRDLGAKSSDPDNQTSGFTGLALTAEPGARLWSKAGWTSTKRHDAAYVELPDGTRFVLVTFTTDHSNEREIIPTVARVILARLANVKPGAP